MIARARRCAEFVLEDLDDLRNSIRYNPNICAIMIINPDNPTGMVYTEETLREIVEIARKVTGHPIPIREMPRRAGDPAVLVASPEKARRLLGWNPQHSDVRSIIQSAWDWHKSHPNGYCTK